MGNSYGYVGRNDPTTALLVLAARELRRLEAAYRAGDRPRAGYYAVCLRNSARQLVTRVESELPSEVANDDDLL